MLCPLCGGDCVKIGNDNDSYVIVHCLTYQKVINVSSSIELSYSNDEKIRICNLLFEAVMKTDGEGLSNGRLWYYYAPDYKTKDSDSGNRINLGEIEYPSSVSNKIDRVLMNLKRINNSIGHVFIVDDSLERAFFIETKEEKETMGVLSLLRDEGYIRTEGDLGFRITKQGWSHIEELESCKDKMQLEQAGLETDGGDKEIVVL